MKKSIFGYLLLFYTFGCYSDTPLFDGKSCDSDCIIFQGQVFDPNNNVPVTAEVTIIHKTGNKFSIPNTIGKINSDENGDFIFKFDGTNYREDVGYFIVKAEKEGFLSNNIDGRKVFYTIDESDFDQPINADISLIPEATLEVSVHVEKKSLDSRFEFSFRYANTTYLHPFSSNQLPLDTVWVFEVGGDQIVEINSIYRMNNMVEETDHSKFVKAGETEKLVVRIE
jgi:hypothetical protein